MIKSDDNLGMLVQTTDLTDDCWEATPAAFVKRLVQVLRVRVFPRENVGGIIYGSSVPSESDKGRIWAKSDTSGNFEGFFAYSRERVGWHQYYNLPTRTKLVYIGDKDNLPYGFIFAGPDNSAGLPDFSSELSGTAPNQQVPVYWIGFS